MNWLSPQALVLAWQKVQAKSHTAGIDGMTVDNFATAIGANLEVLRQQLMSDIYSNSPALGFYIPKKAGKRLIGIATVTDRIIQRLLLHQIYCQLEEQFLDCSYAYRPGRGIHSAIEYFSHHYQYYPCWIIKADIKHFFESLSWALLFTQLESLSLNSHLASLLEKQIKAGIILQGQYLNFGQGVLPGGLMSGVLANLYINDFDRRCLSQGFSMVRYGDDFLIACSSLKEAEARLESIDLWLREIYLSLHPLKTHIYGPNESFIFLGHQFVNGQIYPPQRKSSKAPKIDPICQPKSLFISRPPKVIQPIQQTNFIPYHPNSYWQEPMTTLYITEQGSYVKVKNQQFLVFYHQDLRCKIPVNQVTHIVLFGCCHLSHSAIKLALFKHISILFLSQKGHYFGKLQAEGRAKVAYLTQQVQCSVNMEFVQKQAEKVVYGKLHNSRALLLKLNRRHSTQDAKYAIDFLATTMAQLSEAQSLDALRGYEGKAAAVYFQALGSLFNAPFQFTTRTRRPPKDSVNSLLSLGYTLLNQNVHSFIQGIGLHTHFGNLHVPRDNHPALVSDLMEEFRAQFVDSLVVYLVNSKIFTEEDFTNPDKNSGVYLQNGSLKKFLKHWEDKLQTQITHPNTGYKVTYRRCIELQVREYIACLMGETEVYRPMLWNL